MPDIDTANTPRLSASNRGNRLTEVAGLFLRLGFTAFGGPAAHIAMLRDEVVHRRKWISDERFIDLMGIASIIPGPTSTELAIYVGYLRAGWPGLVLAGVCFILPAMIIVLALAWAYVTYGALPQIGWLFYGIQPVVVAIIAVALWNLSRTLLKGIWPVLFALALLILYLSGINVLIILFGGGLLYGLGSWAQQSRMGKNKMTGLSLLPLSSWHAGWKATATAILGGGAAGAATVNLWALFLTFLKYGAVVYGSGYVLLAFLRTDLVQNLHWLTDQQLLDAISVGQFTPGPVFTTATFIGYLIGSWPGAVLATVGIFLPSFILILLVHPVAERLRASTLTAPLLKGINIAAIALMGGVLVQLAQHAFTDVLTVALALISFAILVRFKLNSVWLILLGALIGLLRFGVVSLLHL